MLRLASPDARLGALGLGAGEFLYGAISLRYARDALLLRDVHERNRAYVLAVGLGDDEQVIGCRPGADSPITSLDIDLYDAITAQGHDPRAFPGLSPYYARIRYQAAEGSWSIRLEERAHVPLFVNHERAGSRGWLRLTAGDVLSFGPSVTHYYARLVVEVTKG